LCVPNDGGEDKSVSITQDCLNQHVLKFDVAYTKSQHNGQMTGGLSSPADYAGLKDSVKCGIVGGHDGSCCNNGGACSPAASNDDRWVLPQSGVNGNRFTMRYILPAGVTCERCVLQWHWQTGNSPWSFPEGFWGCADIRIQAGSGGGTPIQSPVPSPVPNPVPNPVPSPVPNPVPAPSPKPTPPTPEGMVCKRKVTWIVEGWCESHNCDPQWADYCHFVSISGPTPVPAPTPEPTSAVGNVCRSKVSHIPDVWCQQVACDPVYIQFCGYFTEKTNSFAGEEANVIPFYTQDECTTTIMESKLQGEDPSTLARIQVTLPNELADAPVEYEIGKELKLIAIIEHDKGVTMDFTASFVASSYTGRSVEFRIEETDRSTGSNLGTSSGKLAAGILGATALFAAPDHPEYAAVCSGLLMLADRVNAVCPTSLSLKLILPENTEWAANKDTIVEGGFALEDGTSGIYFYIPA